MTLVAVSAPATAQAFADPASSGPVAYDPDRAAAIALTASLNRQPSAQAPIPVEIPPAPAPEVVAIPTRPSIEPIIAAQPTPRLDDGWTEEARLQTATVTAQLNRQAGFNVAAGRAFGPPIEFASDFAGAEAVGPLAATSVRDIWHEGEGYSDRLRLRQRGQLRRADGSPLPLTPLDRAAFEADGYDLSYTRGWQAARGYTPSGLEVTLTPHAGVGVGDRGGRAEAGATLTIGGDIDGMVPEGTEAFGDRARWYLYAAGSGTAVGYNFARNRDGEYARSGVSRDSGSFLGDASIGVAMRRGHVQGSFGLVYREVEAEGLRGGEGFDRDVSEGLVAFQLSIKPE